MKPVPDPASAGERLGPDGRLDRAAVPAVINGNDEYALEAALKLIEAAGEGEVTLLSMAPASAPETMRKALAMGATRGVLVTDPALEGLVRRLDDPRPRRGARDASSSTSCSPASTPPTARRASSRRASPRSPGCRTSRTPRRSSPTRPPGTVRVRRISPTGYDVLEAPMPALISGTQALGEPRYPSLKGIMAARSKEIATLLAGGPRPRSGDGRRRRRPRPASSASQAAGGSRRHAGRPRARPTTPPARSSTSSPSGGSSDGRASSSSASSRPTAR